MSTTDTNNHKRVIGDLVIDGSKVSYSDIYSAIDGGGCNM